MKNKKIILISIIVIILIIIALCGGILYFGTDLLKTDKQLFLKYSSQILSNSNGENKILEYADKKELNSYTYSGKITTKNSSQDEDYQKLLDVGNDVSISFEGKKDKINNKGKLDVNLNYSEDVKFPLEIIRDADITATLVHKHNINPSILHRLKHNKPISTVTIDMFCKLLKCNVDGIIRYTDD